MAGSHQDMATLPLLEGNLVSQKMAAEMPLVHNHGLQQNRNFWNLPETPPLVHDGFQPPMKPAPPPTWPGAAPGARCRRSSTRTSPMGPRGDFFHGGVRWSSHSRTFLLIKPRHVEAEDRRRLFGWSVFFWNRTPQNDFGLACVCVCVSCFELVPFLRDGVK